MKTSRACTGMLSSENDVFKFLKTAKNKKKQVHHSSSRAIGTVLSLQSSLSLPRNMNIKVAIELYYIFSKILLFKYWLYFTDAEYIFMIKMKLHNTTAEAGNHKLVCM